MTIADHLKNLYEKLTPKPDKTKKDKVIQKATTAFQRHYASQEKKDSVLSQFLTSFKRHHWVVVGALAALIFVVSPFFKVNSPVVDPVAILDAPIETITKNVSSKVDVPVADEVAIIDTPIETIIENVSLAHVENVKPKVVPEVETLVLAQLDARSVPDRHMGFAMNKTKKYAVRHAVYQESLDVSSISHRSIMPPPIPRPIPTDSGDRFESISAHGIRVVKDHPVSTFSADVDTASYSYIRRLLNQGQLPKKDSIRIEEMINYFNYDYDTPVNQNQPFKPTISVFPSPWNSETKLLHIGIKGYVPEQQQKSNLVFLIDTSGSMSSPDKLPLLITAFKMMITHLHPEDSVSIVTYAGRAGTVLEPTKVAEKRDIMDALDRLQSGGSTAGAAGIRQAYSLAEKQFDKSALNRVILATDGDFNVGISDPNRLKEYIAKKRDTGIYLSVLGFGQGNYNDVLMQKLAQNGNGVAYYIDSMREAQKVFVQGLASTLFTIAKDVKFQIEFNPAQVAEYRLVGYETRVLKTEDFNNDRVDSGDIGAGHSVTAIYEITPAAGSFRFVDDLRYKDTQQIDSKSNEIAYLKMRYKHPKSKKSQLITYPITEKHSYSRFSQVPSEIRFSSSVAAFGQLLQNSQFVDTFDYDSVFEIAKGSTGKDQYGYRSEFLNLIQIAKMLAQLEALK